MRILIVDDDSSLRQMLEVTFDVDARFSVVRTAETPEEALRVAAEITPDVVLVDNVLAADGSEVGRHLRELLPGSRLISFSGSERDAAWADFHVTKDGDSQERLTQAIFDEGVSTVAGSPPSLDESEIRRFIHDLRNPLGALNGFTHILKTSKGALSEEKQAQVLDSMSKSSERLSKLVDEFAARYRVNGDR